MTSDFGKSLTTSILFHGAIFMLIFVKVLLSPSIPMEIRHAIRVDVVGLPDKVQAPAEIPKAPSPEPVAAPAPPPKVEKLPTKVEPAKPSPAKPVVDLNAKKKDLAKEQKRAMDQLKARDALEKIKSEVSDEQKQEKIALLKGSQVNKGNSLTGLEKIEFDRYFDDMESHLRENWSLPQWLADAHFKAQALVAIDENGIVIRKQLVKSSGNSVFDTHVLEAIDRSSPFPVPPDRLRGVLATRGVVFNFPEQ